MTETSESMMLERHLLSCETYLRSPILTLAASIEDPTNENVTFQDRVDAYITFSNRIRAISNGLISKETQPSALQTLAINSSAFARCLQRDIRLAAGDLYPSASQDMLYSTACKSPYDSLRHEDIFRNFRDTSAVAQQALRVTAAILRFPALYSMFSESIISQLLDDLMVIARNSDPRSFDGCKATAIAAWTFSTIQIPSSILITKKAAIVEWMGYLLGSLSPQSDNSKIIYHLLTTYPTIFIPYSSTFLSDILSKLVTADVAVRVDSTLVLSGYVLALSSISSAAAESLKVEVFAEVRLFLNSQLSGGGGGSHSQMLLQLPQYIKVAAASDISASEGEGPRWAVTVLCAFLLLSGGSIFESKRLCGFVLETAEQIAKNKRQPGPSLLACLWKCIIWAFSQLPPEDDNSHTSGDILHVGTRPSSNRRRAAFDIVKQELRNGTGAFLVARLLYARPGHPHICGDTPSQGDNDIGLAISVVNSMISHPQDSIYRDGVAIVLRMISRIGSSLESTVATKSDTWTPNDIPVKILFQRHVLTANLPAYSTALQDASLFNPLIVRPLLEHEIHQRWRELLVLWTHCIHRELQQTVFAMLPDSLTHVWQALLLVETDLTQGHAHLTTTPEYIEAAVSAVASFLKWKPQATKEHPPLSSVSVQRRVLSVCHQLWDTMRNVFADTVLSSAAGSLLVQTARYTFDLSDEGVKSDWSRFCSALLSKSVSDLVARLAVEQKEHQTADLRRELWVLTAKTWISHDSAPKWTDIVEFLALPIRYWSLSEGEMITWDTILDHAASQAYMSSGSSLAFFDALFENCFIDGDVTSLLNAPTTVMLLLSKFKVKGMPQAQSSFLRNISTFLIQLYSDLPDHITTALCALSYVRRIVRECPKNALSFVLSSLADGLSIWVGDQSELLLEQEHKDIVVPLYCEALEVLREIPISSDTLGALAHFFYSAFIRIPDPGDGPVAFYQFWIHIQPSLAHLKGTYPEDIKTALRALHDVCGVDLPAGFSFETDSQTGSLGNDHPAPMTSPIKSRTPIRWVGFRCAEGSTHNSTGISLSSIASPLQQNSSRLAGSESSPIPAAEGFHQNHHPSQGPAEAGSPLQRNDYNARTSSVYVPSSPTEAVRIRHLAAGTISRVSHERPALTPDRPLKRPKVSSPATPKGAPSYRQDAAGPLKVKARNAPPPSFYRSKWPFDGVEVKSHRNRVSPTGSKTPQPPKAQTTLPQLSSPNIPSPAVGARASAHSSDDYDAWEVPILAEADGGEDMDVVPDSQPSHDRGDDDSLLPTFMKMSHKGKRRQSPNATMLLRDGHSREHDNDIPAEKSLGKRPQHASRMHTAPASFLHEPSPAAVPLRRARTASAKLEELRNMCDVLEQDGSQLEVKDIMAASALTNRLGTLLNEKLSKKLGGDAGRST